MEEKTNKFWTSNGNGWGCDGRKLKTMEALEAARLRLWKQLGLDGSIAHDCLGSAPFAALFDGRTQTVMEEN